MLTVPVALVLNGSGTGTFRDLAFLPLGFAGHLAGKLDVSLTANAAQLYAGSYQFSFLIRDEGGVLTLYTNPDFANLMPAGTATFGFDLHDYTGYTGLRVQEASLAFANIYGTLTLGCRSISDMNAVVSEFIYQQF